VSYHVIGPFHHLASLLLIKNFYEIKNRTWDGTKNTIVFLSVRPFSCLKIRNLGHKKDRIRTKFVRVRTQLIGHFHGLFFLLTEKNFIMVNF